MNTKYKKVISRRYNNFLCGAQFVPVLLLFTIALILCKSHITRIQLFETVLHWSINQNTCTYVHVIPIHPPTF